MDGTTLDVTVPQRELVREVKRSVGQVRGESSARHGHAVNSHHVYPTAALAAQLRDVNPALTELFIDGTENALPDSGRLNGLGLGEGSVVFMLQRLGWCWTEGGSVITLSEDGLVATNRVATEGWHLVTGGEPMTEGRHFWEVELTKWAPTDAFRLLIGAVRPGLDHDEDQSKNNDAYFIDASDGALEGNGKEEADQQGEFEEGDRIGVLLDLDAGWLRFYRNGKRCGPGHTEGVTGPLVCAAQLGGKGDKLTVLPGAVAPEGAGDADEPWDKPELATEDY
jgi:hypothetical protein